MATSHTEQQGKCPLTTVKTLANETATAKLTTATGDAAATGAVKKKVTSTATLSTAVTENGKVRKEKVSAGVTLAVETSEDDAPACDCDADCDCGCQ